MATVEELQGMLSNIKNLQAALSGVNPTSGNVAGSTQSLIQVMSNPTFRDLTKDFAVPSQGDYTAQSIANRLGINYDLGSIQDTYRDAINSSYDVANNDYKRAQNNYYNTILGTGNATLDAIRRARASGIQSGQNVGANWLQELSAALSLGQQTTTDATALANQQMKLADQYVADLSAAEREARSYYDTLGLQLGSHGNDVAALDLQQYIAELQAQLTTQTNQTQADIAGLQTAASMLVPNGYSGSGYSGSGYTGNGTGTGTETVTDSRKLGPYEQAVWDNTKETDAFREQKLAAARIMDANYYGENPSIDDINAVNLVGAENIWNTTSESGNNPMASGQLNMMRDNIWKNVSQIAMQDAVYYVPGADGSWIRSNEEKDKMSYVKGGINLPANAAVADGLKNEWLNIDPKLGVNLNTARVNPNKVREAISSYVTGNKKAFDSLNYWEKQAAANRIQNTYTASVLNNSVAGKAVPTGVSGGAGMKFGSAGQKSYLDSIVSGMSGASPEYRGNFANNSSTGTTTHINTGLNLQDSGLTIDDWWAGLTPAQRNAYQNDSSNYYLDYALASSLINNPAVSGTGYTLEALYPNSYGNTAKPTAKPTVPALDVIGLGQGPLTQEAAQKFAAQQGLPKAMQGLPLPGQPREFTFGPNKDTSGNKYMGMRTVGPTQLQIAAAKLKEKLNPTANTTAVRAGTLTPNLSGAQLGTDRLAQLREQAAKAAEAQRKAAAAASSKSSGGSVGGFGGSGLSAGVNTALDNLKAQAAQAAQASAAAAQKAAQAQAMKPPASLATQANHEQQKGQAAQAAAAQAIKDAAAKKAIGDKIQQVTTQPWRKPPSFTTGIPNYMLAGGKK